MGKTITTIGGVTQDVMYYTDDMLLIDNKDDLLRQKLIGFEYGAKIYTDNIYFVYGGGGANTAVGLASLGVATQTMVCLGKDILGRNIIKYFKNKGVGTNLIQQTSKKGTATSFIINVGSFNEHVIFAYRGAAALIDLNTKVVKKIKTPWVYLASIAGNHKKSLANLFAHCAKKKIKVAWNPGLMQLKMGLQKLAKYLKNTEILIVNRDEALELLVSTGKGKIKNNINQILKKLHQVGGQKITVITDGAKGAYVYDGQKVYFRAALKHKGINTTGAGDSFGSGFVAGFIKHHNIVKALHLGILNSNSVIMKIGAQEGLLNVRDLAKYKL